MGNWKTGGKREESGRQDRKWESEEADAMEKVDLIHGSLGGGRGGLEPGNFRICMSVTALESCRAARRQL